MANNMIYRLLSPLFQEEIQNAVRSQLSTWVENDTTFYESGLPNLRDRLQPDRMKILTDSLEAWQTNPLARRIVSLTTQYVVGGGINFTCKHEVTLAFMRQWFNHPLNGLLKQVYEWCDELTRTGDLFLLLSPDSSGMSYIRAIPTSMVDQIQCKPTDVDQETCFIMRDEFKSIYPVFDFKNPTFDKPAALHFTINRPVGAQWGESDLAPALKWLSRYSNWLEDRARLNRYRNAFLFIVKGKFKSNAERIARQRELNAQPPNPGSIIVADMDNEEWEVISPKLESTQAGEDGLALKKMIAAGSGIPMHFLAEPESSTRTTAEAAGGPTYRHFEQRQNLFVWMMKTVFQAAVTIRATVDNTVDKSAEIVVTGSDISSRDNISLAMATSNITSALSNLRDRQLIDDQEFLRLIYRFCGETADVEDMLKRGDKAGPPKLPPDRKSTDARPPDVDSLRDSPVDPETGEPKPLKSDV